MTILKGIPLLLEDINICSVFFRILLATTIGALIGMNRGRHGRAAGTRTHILVCLGAAITTLLGFYTTESLGFSNDPLRMGAQVVSGIGFLGVGTILVRNHSQVTGLTTAAGLWTTATIGIASGLGFYSGAVICAAFFFLAAGALTKVETIGKNGKNIIRVYLECDDASVTNAIIDTLTTPEYGLYNIEITPPRTGISNHLGIEAVMPIPKNVDPKELVGRLARVENILFAVESV